MRNAVLSVTKWTLAVAAVVGAGRAVAAPTLSLSALPASQFVQPGEVVTVRMDVSGLGVAVNACQAMLGYSSTYFVDPVSGPIGGALSPGGGAWDSVLYDSWREGVGISGRIDSAIVVDASGDVGTVSDGTIAVISLLAGATEGVTALAFRPDAVPDPGLTASTFLTDLMGAIVWPSKVDSGSIVIDGTPPVVVVSSAVEGMVNVLNGAEPVTPGVVVITVTATDPLAGLAGAPTVVVSNGMEVISLTTSDVTSPFQYSWTVDGMTTLGRWHIMATAADQAGNEGADVNDYLSVGQPNLFLTVPPASQYVRPGELVVLSMNVTRLPRPVNACQAMLGYSSVHFVDPIAGVGALAPGGGPWDTVLYDSWRDGADVAGEIDSAITVDALGLIGTEADGTVATITLLAGATEGVTTVVFRPDAMPDPGLTESTFLSDLLGGIVWPEKTDSTSIVIDGTGPALAVSSALEGATDVLDGANTTVQGTVVITVTASDGLSGLSGIPSVVLSNGMQLIPLTTTDVASPFHYSWMVDATTANGRWDILASAGDLAGNMSEDLNNYLSVNKNRVAGQVELEGFVGTGTVPAHTREVTFVATGGASTKTWTVSLGNVSGAVFDFALTDVPDGTTGLSAKTAWNLRRKMVVALDGDGQGGVSFIGASKLRGGDLTGDNQVQFFDYSTLRSHWFTTDAVADINGDGQVQTLDYVLLGGNWFTAGDPL